MIFTVQQACDFFSVCRKTIYRWCSSGRLCFFRTLGGHRRIVINKAKESNAVDLAYCRVSSCKQKDDLNRQVEFMRENTPPQTLIVKDIGSGVNFRRQKLRFLLQQCLAGKVKRVFVAYNDRLARIGLDLFRTLFTLLGIELVSIGQKHETREESLASDIVAIMHSFSSKSYSMRRG